MQNLDKQIVPTNIRHHVILDTLFDIGLDTYIMIFRHMEDWLGGLMFLISCCKGMRMRYS